MSKEASDYLTGTGLVIAVALAMVTMTMPATATHNSVGVNVNIAEASQINEDTGEIDEDIVDGGQPDRIANNYHGNLGPHLPVRDGPQDQSGDAYTRDCQPFHEFGSVEEYEHALPNWADEDLSDVDNFYAENGSVDEAAVQDPETGQWIHQDAIDAAPDDACYVGYLEMKAQYSMSPLIFGIGGDPLYGLNPPPDSDCDRGDYFIEVIEELTGDSDGDCPTLLPWGGHNQRIHEHWHTLTIDTDLVETAFVGEQGVASQFEPQEETNRYEGSGPQSLDFGVTYMVFLFGYAHPANENPSGIDATWDGFDLPMHGVPDSVCGTLDDDTARTPPAEECQILSPRDLELYDTVHHENSNLPAGSEGRLCSIRPDSGTINPSAPQQAPCGPLGDQINNYDVDPEAGGFVQEENEDGEYEPAVAPTYINTLPGWQSHFFTLPYADHGTVDWLGLDWPTEDLVPMLAFNETGQEGDYIRRMVAVNPEVPDIGGNLECAWPQIATDGGTVNGHPDYESWATERIQTIQDSDDYASVQDYFDQEFDVIDHFGIAHPDDPDGDTSLGNVSAPGVYGTYQTAALDLGYWGEAWNSIMYGGIYHGNGVPGYDGYGEDVYPTVDDLFAAANNVVGDANEELDALQDEVEPIETPEELDELIEQITETLDTATEDVDALVSQLFAELNDIEDQHTPFSSGDPDPWRNVEDPTYESFNRTLEMGVGCNSSGNLALTEKGQTIEGALNYGINLQVNGERLQDPTKTNDEGEPARESNTSYGAWEPAWYSFAGPSVAYLDTTGNGGYSGCAEQDGTTDPNDDVCPWFIPWDVWGGISGAKENLEEDGFRVNESEWIDTAEPYGNGQFYTIELTGTALISPYPTTLPNTNNPVRSAESHMSETFLVNAENPSATTCIVASSSGFWNETRILRHFDKATTETLNSLEQAAEEFLCSDKADRVETVGSGYFWQSGTSDNDWSSYIYWNRLLPTPEATQEVVDTDDVICNTIVLSHDAGTEVGQGKITLGPDGQTTTYYNNCLSLEEEFYEDGNPTKEHPLDGTYNTLPNFADNKR